MFERSMFQALLGSRSWSEAKAIDERVNVLLNHEFHEAVGQLHIQHTGAGDKPTRKLSIIRWRASNSAHALNHTPATPAARR
jgi:hypothetical protein